MDFSIEVYNAACVGDIDSIRVLHQNGACVLAANGIGDTAMFAGAKFGHVAVIEMMHELGADINAVNNFLATPLYCASSYGHTDCILKLLELGADISVRDEDGHTALHGAAMLGHGAAVLLLYERGLGVSTPDFNNHTPLALAASHGRTEVVRLLLELGSPARCRDNYGLTPLHLAAECGHIKTVMVLLAFGVEVDEQASSRDVEPGLTSLADPREATNSSFSSEQSQVSSGPTSRADGVDFSGYTPLLMAAGSGFLSVVVALHNAGADLDARACDGRTPLCAAAENGNALCLRYIINHGVSCNGIVDNIALVMSVRLVLAEFDISSAGYCGSPEMKRDTCSLVKLIATHAAVASIPDSIEFTVDDVRTNSSSLSTRRLALEKMLAAHFSLQVNCLGLRAVVVLRYAARSKVVGLMLGAFSRLPPNFRWKVELTLSRVVKLFFCPRTLQDVLSLRTCRFFCSTPGGQLILESPAVERFLGGDVSYYIPTGEVQQALDCYRVEVGDEM